MLRHAAGAGLDAAHLRVRPARIAARRIIKQVAFFSWYAAQACILFGACLFASSLAYGLAYWLWIPRPLHTFPVYFVYGNGGSAAELFGAPLLSRQSHPDASNTLPEAFIDLRDDGRATWQRSVYAERWDNILAQSDLTSRDRCTRFLAARRGIYCLFWLLETNMHSISALFSRT